METQPPQPIINSESKPAYSICKRDIASIESTIGELARLLGKLQLSVQALQAKCPEFPAGNGNSQEVSNLREYIHTLHPNAIADIYRSIVARSPRQDQLQALLPGSEAPLPLDLQELRRGIVESAIGQHAIRQKYRLILAREPNEDEIRARSRRLIEGEITIGALARELAESEEARQRIEIGQAPGSPASQVNPAYFQLGGKAVHPHLLRGPEIAHLQQLKHRTPETPNIGAYCDWVRGQGCNGLTINPQAEFFTPGTLQFTKITPHKLNSAALDAITELAHALNERHMFLDLLYWGQLAWGGHPAKAFGYDSPAEAEVYDRLASELKDLPNIIHRMGWDMWHDPTIAHTGTHKWADRIRSLFGEQSLRGVRANRVNGLHFPTQLPGDLSLLEWELIRPEHEQLIALRSQSNHKPIGATDIYRQTELYKNPGNGPDRNITEWEQFRMRMHGLFAGGIMQIQAILPDTPYPDGSDLVSRGSLPYPHAHWHRNALEWTERHFKNSLKWAKHGKTLSSSQSTHRLIEKAGEGHAGACTVVNLLADDYAEHSFPHEWHATDPGMYIVTHKTTNP